MAVSDREAWRTPIAAQSSTKKKTEKELPLALPKKSGDAGSLLRSGLNWTSILNQKSGSTPAQRSKDLTRHSLGDLLPLRNPLRGKLSNVLIEKLRSPDTRTRFQAAEALGEQGARAGQAVPALTRALEDSEARVRYFAAQALGNIGLKPQHSAAPLVRLMARELNTAPSSPRTAASRALAKLALAHPDTVMPLLVSELGSDNEGIQLGVESALIRIGANNRSMLLSYLDRATFASTPLLQACVARLLEKLG